MAVARKRKTKKAEKEVTAQSFADEAAQNMQDDAPKETTNTQAKSTTAKKVSKTKKAKKTPAKLHKQDSGKTGFTFLPIATVFLVIGLLISAVAVTEQIHQYRMSFSKSQALRTETKKLNTEWQKLLLEQQTFGATTRISSRAVVMGMYSPKQSDIISMTLKPVNPEDITQ